MVGLRVQRVTLPAGSKLVIAVVGKRHQSGPDRGFNPADDRLLSTECMRRLGQVASISVHSTVQSTSQNMALSNRQVKPKQLLQNQRTLVGKVQSEGRFARQTYWCKREVLSSSLGLFFYS